MQNTISDFTENQLQSVSGLLTQHYGKPVELQLADTELQLDIESEELTLCPTLYWTERGAHFVVPKVGEGLYRCQFFYTATEQFGTEHENYDGIEQCVATLLQVQSDHERQMASLSPVATTIAALAGEE